MLVIRRKVQESVIIGEDNGPHRVLKVKVLAIQGNQVKLGFTLDEGEHWEVLRGVRNGIAADLPANGLEAAAPVQFQSPWCAPPMEDDLTMSVSALEM